MSILLDRDAKCRAMSRTRLSAEVLIRSMPAVPQLGRSRDRDVGEMVELEGNHFRAGSEAPEFS